MRGASGMCIAPRKADHQEEDRHDGAEEAATSAVPMPLHGKKRDKHDNRERQNIGIKNRRRDSRPSSRKALKLRG